MHRLQGITRLSDIFEILFVNSAPVLADIMADTGVLLVILS